VPYAILFPFILLFCLIGSYSINNSVGDGIVMWVFGVLGYLMKKFNYEGAPLVLAMVIGPMMEEAMRQSLILSTGSAAIFFTRPISAGFILTAAFLFVLPLLTRRKGVEKAWESVPEEPE
jgi:putative tricarboxylic transport membrane protein